LPTLADMEVTDADLAALAGVSARHIRRLGLPKMGRNAYRLGDAFAALLEGLSGGDAGAELTKERVRLVKAQADKAEMEYALARSEIAPVRDFERATAKLMAAIRANILNVPARAVLQLLGETDETTFKARLRAELVLALEQSAQAEFDLDDDEDEGEGEAAP